MQDNAPRRLKVATELLKKNKIFVLEQHRNGPRSSREPVDKKSILFFKKNVLGLKFCKGLVELRINSLIL